MKKDLLSSPLDLGRLMTAAYLLIKTLSVQFPEDKPPGEESQKGLF